MLLDLSDLKRAGSKRRLKTEINIANIDFSGRKIEIPEQFLLDLNIYNTRDSFIFSGVLKGYLLLRCSRCLEKFRFPVEVELDEEMEKKDIEDIKNINLQKLFVENILLTIPLKPLCSEDCQGLCSECGKNLNEGQCDCNQEKIDPRMEKLKELLDK